jgi:hypothetical protein
MQFRLATEDDFEACIRLLKANDRGRPGDDTVTALPALWAAYLAQDRRRPKPFAVWEDAVADAAAEGATTLHAFGLAVFVSDAVYEGLLASPGPSLADAFYGQVRSGTPGAMLDTQAIARANAGQGLNLISPLYVQRHWDFQHPDTQRLLPLTAAAWYLNITGFNVRRMLSEYHGERAAQYICASGAQRVRTFAPPEGLPAELHAPIWFEHHRERMPPAGVFDSMSHWIKPPPPPRMRLTPAQQSIAFLALQGDTDQRIAARLQITTDAVKKAWRAIIAHASLSIPALRSGALVRDGLMEGEGAVRGTERRRVVIEFLRQHLEELRPWPRSRAGGAKTGV